MYRQYLLYTVDAELVGAVIKDDDAIKLQSTNIYLPDEGAELAKKLQELNRNDQLLQHWPNVDDPDVHRLLMDDSWEPIEKERAEVVDDENSYYVYTQVPETDLNGDPTGETINGELDQEASVIATKEALVPVRQSDVTARIHKACETVAKQRAGLAA